MNTPNTFSLSLQKQFGHEPMIDDRQLNRTFSELKFGSLVL
jgi:hypothetical protein